jgi:Transposase
MKQKRFSETEIMQILKQAEQGVAVPDLCREHGMSNASFYKWRSKYSIKPRKRLKRERSEKLAVPEKPNDTWSIDFMAEHLSSGRTFRTFIVFPLFSEAKRVDKNTIMQGCVRTPQGSARAPLPA